LPKQASAPFKFKAAKVRVFLLKSSAQEETPHCEFERQFAENQKSEMDIFAILRDAF
jgi:hypothetical protein